MLLELKQSFVAERERESIEFGHAGTVIWKSGCLSPVWPVHPSQTPTFEVAGQL